jgi:hypothetical protein
VTVDRRLRNPVQSLRRKPTVPFFEATKGFIVNYTLDCAVEFDTDGNAVASFE